MKKQLQKIFLLFFLTSCMAAPYYSFKDDLKSNKIYQIPFQKIIFLSEQKNFDSSHHIENRLPQKPEQIIQDWIQENLKEDSSQKTTLEIILHQAEIIREKNFSSSWWKPDYIKDTLIYKIELIQQDSTSSNNHLIIAGKSYAQMKKRTSLTDKEKQWAKLFRTMLNHMELEISNKIPNVIISYKK